MNNQIMVERHVSYEKRTDHINGYDICVNDCSKLEICILSKNSFGTLNGWFDSQCKYLPNNLKYVQEKYSESNNKLYVIMSFRNHTKSQDKRISNNATLVQIFLDAKLLTLCFLIIVLNIF